MLPSFVRSIFWFLNKFFMVPIFRLGIGPFFGNPIWGYMMVLKTIGRKSGKTRYSPVNYAIMNGNIYCMAGWGQIADWYRNLISDHNIEMILPISNIERVLTALLVRRTSLGSRLYQQVSRPAVLPTRQ